MPWVMVGRVGESEVCAARGSSGRTGGRAPAASGWGGVGWGRVERTIETV
jgi:hypothetical protein